MQSADEVRASQDLYYQYQEQKRRIEEELKQMEKRDDMWRQLHTGMTCIWESSFQYFTVTILLLLLSPPLLLLR